MFSVLCVCQPVHGGGSLIWPLQTCSNLLTWGPPDLFKLVHLGTPPAPPTALGLPSSTLQIEVMFYYLAFCKWGLLTNCICNVWTNKWPLSIDYVSVSIFVTLENCNILRTQGLAVVEWTETKTLLCQGYLLLHDFPSIITGNGMILIAN